MRPDPFLRNVLANIVGALVVGAIYLLYVRTTRKDGQP